MKKILLTGANGGLGKAVTKYFIQNGFFVYRTDVSFGEELPNSKQILSDNTNSESIKKLREIIKNETDSLDAIVHVAGYFNMDSFIEIEERDLRKIFDINFFGAYLINTEFFDLVKNDGRIVIVTSEVATLYPLPFESIYGLTKSTLDNYASALRMELMLHNVPVTVVRPGAIKTEFLGASTTALDRLCEKTKLYNYNAKRFKHIVEKTESKAVEPIKVAKLIFKATTVKKPKFTYKINHNKGLKLLNALPKKMQAFIIKKILKQK